MGLGHREKEEGSPPLVVQSVVGYGDGIREAEHVHHGTEWQHGAEGAVLGCGWVNWNGRNCL